MFLPGYHYVISVDLDCHQSNVGHTLHAPILIFDGDMEGRESCVWSTGFGYGIGAGAHEVIFPHVKCPVMGVTPSPASGRRLRHAHLLAILHFVSLLLPALYRSTRGNRLSFWVTKNSMLFNGLDPGYLMNHIVLLGLAHPTRDGRESIFWIPSVKELQLSGSRRAFSAAAPALWNIVASRIRSGPNLLSFHKSLTTELCRLARESNGAVQLGR